MRKFFELDSENRIVITADRGRITSDGIIGEQFDFPDDFDFERQYFFKIINGKLVEDTEAVAAEKAEQIRNERDILLKESDWTQMPDSPLTSEMKYTWANYRQQLRDIPQQEEFPFDVVFPEKPE